MTRLALTLPAIALLLAACGDSDEAADAAATENVGPQGEVYGGTISDDMLPIGEVKSQSPQRARSKTDGGDDGAGDDAE